MLSILTPINIWTAQNRFKMPAVVAVLTAILTYISGYIYMADKFANISLAIGTGICAFITISIYHFLLFSNLISKPKKFGLIALFPVVYTVFLFGGFGLLTSAMTYEAYDVSLWVQFKLFVWAYLGQCFFYLTFSPKIPLILTCISVIALFLGALKQKN